LRGLEELECNIKQFQAISSPVLNRTSILIGAGVAAGPNELINKVPVRSLQLQPIESCQFGQLQTLSKVKLRLPDLLFAHLMGNRSRFCYQVCNILSTADCRRSPGLKTERQLTACCPSGVTELDEDLPSSLVNCISD
jgi:hypothetical protein